MTASRALDLAAEDSPLEAARTRRGLSRAEAAAQAALSPEEVAWLEDGRLYRFRSPHYAAAAAAIYAAALGIDHREALELSGRPLPPRTPEATLGRLLVAGAVAVALIAALAAVLVVPRVTGDDAAEGPAAGLPPPWRVKVDVLNGSGDINYTRRVADDIGALAYHVERVGKASRFDYPETVVFYPPNAQPLAQRLADELCAPTKPLPGSTDKQRLLVIVGPASVGGC